MILPAKRSFYLLGVHIALAIVVSIQPAWLNLWYMAVGGSLVAWLVDALRTPRRQALQVKRDLPPSLAVGVQRPIQIQLSQNTRNTLHLRLYDHYPAGIQVQGMPLSLSLAPEQKATLNYSIRPVERGKHRFPATQVRVLSPWQLWWRDVTYPLADEVRVYPNFAAIAHYALLATDNQLSQMGIMKRRRRGEGQDFHQLREYRPGDSLRQIDWKASARMHKPISREYQDERDQEIIFLLDCGHRMQARDDELSHFDHTLNAILLLSYVALKQGDAVGLGTFGGEQRWLPARKGQASLNQVLNALYDLKPTAQAPDYSQAATELLVRQKKRALVILISNLRDEDTDDLLPALHLLRKRHLLLFASMREMALDQVLEQPVDNLEDALEQATTEQYLQTRATTLEQVRSHNIYALDVAPADLSVQLINHYLDIKRSGIL